jgi:hypothetical protein
MPRGVSLGSDDQKLCSAILVTPSLDVRLCDRPTLRINNATTIRMYRAADECQCNERNHMAHTPNEN